MGFNKYYKEKDYVESVLRQRKFNNTIKSDLKLIAKYYKSLNNTDERIEEEIKKLLKKKLVNFNEVLYYKMIDNAITFANKDKNKLIQIDSVYITKNEMDYILELDRNDFDKKILFTFLVVDKLKYKKNEINEVENVTGHYFGSGIFSYKLLLDALQEKITRTYREKGIHKTIKEFNDKGLTKTTNLASVELLFMNDIALCDEIVLEVDDFDTIGLYFDYYIGKIEKSVCKNEECDNMFFVVGRNSKYCKMCSIEIRRKRQKEIMKKRRN